jgi:hypothetical protein
MKLLSFASILLMNEDEFNCLMKKEKNIMADDDRICIYNFLKEVIDLEENDGKEEEEEEKKTHDTEINNNSDDDKQSSIDKSDFYIFNFFNLNLNDELNESHKLGKKKKNKKPNYFYYYVNFSENFLKIKKEDRIKMLRSFANIVENFMKKEE